MNRLIVNTSTKGEKLTTMIKRAMKSGATSETLTESGREKVYTVASAGVLPEYDIKTDRKEVIMKAGHRMAIAETLQKTANETEEATPSENDKTGAPVEVK